MADTAREIAFKLEDVLTECFSESVQVAMRTKIDDALNQAADNFEYHFKQDFTYNMSMWAHRMAESAIEEMLKGNEAEMRRYLRCEEGHYTGRDGRHSVIHGKLFETGAVELRKQIVNAFPDILKSERVLDLEDQVSSLTAEVNRLNARILQQVTDERSLF